jgi:hypothetical protein
MRAARFVLAALVGTLILHADAQGRSAPAYPEGPGTPAHLTVQPDLDAGFHLLYELQFEQAGERFISWEQQQPEEPLGPALEAAAILFEEFYRKGVLTSEFFLDDRRFLGGIPDQPDADLEQRFIAAAQRCEEKARQRLAAQPQDPDALFALTLVAGMRADNLSVLQRRQLESLHYLREAERSARALLAVAPDTGDAYVALGAANYITGCLPAYKRAFLWFGGVHGDKRLGMQQLRHAASEGHYLRPFAKLLLALAALREKHPEIARAELAELAMEFPKNALFARELEKITPVISRATSPTR